MKERVMALDGPPFYGTSDSRMGMLVVTCTKSPGLERASRVNSNSFGRVVGEMKVAHHQPLAVHDANGC